MYEPLFTLLYHNSRKNKKYPSNFFFFQNSLQISIVPRFSLIDASPQPSFISTKLTGHQREEKEEREKERKF